MKLCDDGHDEVCFEGRDCPACLIKEELEKEIADLTDCNIHLENEVRFLEQDNG